MFRLSFLSILCVYVTTSAAFAHDDPGDGFHFGTTRGIELRVGGNNRERFIGQTDPDDDGFHYHRYSYTIFLNGGSVGLIWEKLFKTGESPPGPDDLPNDYFPAINNDQTPDDPPPLPEQIAHYHEYRHQHGNYVRHKHTVHHTGPSAHHTHTYSDAQLHAADGDHSGVGTVPRNENRQPIQNSPRQQPGDNENNPNSEGRRDSTPHSHTVTHQHGNYVSHQHTVTHTGSSSHHTHSYTAAEVHAVDNDHSGVGTQTPRDDNTPSPHSHIITHQHDNYVSHAHTVTHTGDSSQHTHTYTEAEVHSLVGGNHGGVGLRQPSDNDQSSGQQPTVLVPTDETTTSTVATPVVGGDGTPTPQPVGPVETSAPQVVQPVSPLMQPLRVTEYMVRDWGGIPNLPQWIELYNPNTEAVNLKDHTFQYATRPFANHPYVIHTLTLADDTQDGFSIAGGGVAILATQAKLPTRRFSGIQESQVYALDIPNALKSGWVLTDASGKEVYRIGRRAFSALRDPVEPPHQERSRVSHHRYRSEAPSEPHYYGYRHDVGSPGFYEELAPSAPSAVRRKQVGTWAGLKRAPEKF